MKKYLISSLILIGTLISKSSYSQGLAVNTDASTADPSAMLDVKATDKGILIPRLASTAAVTSPVTGLLIYQTNSPAGFYYYDGAGWLLLQNTSQPGGSPTGAAGGSLTGTYPNPAIAPDAVTTAEILDSTITSSDISATAAIPYSKLSLTSSILNADLTPNSVTTLNVADGAVTTIKMADSAINGLKLLTGAVSPVHINTTGASTGQALIYDGSSVNWAAPTGSPTGTAGGSLSGTYPNPAIAPDAVTTAEILDSTITSSDISATAAIPYSKLSLTSSILNADLTPNSVTTLNV
ncbi:MAG: hypothetical protein ABIO55_04095, partial [Ginsengibacter sp.]